jgi:hypothetical protein
MRVRRSGQKYQLALLVSAIVVSIAGCTTITSRIFNGWDAAYSLQNGAYTLTGAPFNECLPLCGLATDGADTRYC